MCCPEVPAPPPPISRQPPTPPPIPASPGGTTPVTRSFVEDRLRPLGDLTPHDLRVDRFLAEVHATGGDPLKLTRLFGVSDPTAIRYCNELGPLDRLIGSEEGT